jgi:hypothetical protein
MARASAWGAPVDMFITRSCLDSRESQAPFVHLSQDFVAFQRPFNLFLGLASGKKKGASEPLVQKGTLWFLRLTRNAHDNDLTESGVDRLAPVSIAWRQR